jgi:hypothetical protein
MVVSFGGCVTRNEGAGFVWRLGYAIQGCCCCLGALLHELGMLVSFGGCVMQNEGAGFVWRLGYAAQGCWHRLGALLHEMVMLASFGGETKVLDSFGG